LKHPYWSKQNSDTKKLSFGYLFWIFLLLFFSFANRISFAQTFPVQTFVQVSPPHTSYLPDYTDPMSNQMKIFLTLTDFTVPSYQVKLKFTLTGNGYTISNQSLLNLPAFTLSPGTPLEISGSDLAPYLATQNLLFSGIDVVDYDQRKVLPEGPCQICVEVIDFSNPNQVVLSNPACSQVWFSLNDPPLTNTPFCGNEIATSDPQQIIFSWSPLHMNSLHSAGTQYTFELFEIRPDGADPNQVVNSSLPIFMQVTDQTFINYGITEPQLQTGMSYAWRVKAQDIQGRDFFRNNGYSAVCTFAYGNIAASLADGITLTLNSTGTGTRVGFAWWNVSSTFTGYKVAVRKTGNPDYEWFPYESSGGELKIYQLEPSTQYECRVKGLIGDDYESEWSNTSVFTTQPTPDYACGNTTIPPVENTLTPLMNAISGMTFTVGQFEMLVTDIQPLDPILKPGHYSGTGKITVAFLYNVRVSFEDILVDDNLMVRSGKVEAITQGVDAWMQSQIEPDFYVDGTITDFEWTDSTSLTVWVDGQPQTFSFDEHDPIIIQDEDGMIYTFNSDGTYSVFSTLTYSNDVLAATADYRIDFSADEDQQFGFDKKQHSEWIHDYEVIRLIDSTNYFVAYKSIGEGSGDDVIANITSDITLLDVNFVADVNGSETALAAEKINDTTYQVHLNGLEESCFVYARHGQLRIGKLWVKVLPEIEIDVVIVPVNGSTLSSVNDLQTNLNKIYAQANAKFNVTVAPNFQSTEWDLNADGKVQTGDVDLMSHYSEEMRLLRDAYFETDSNQNAYYLFVIPEFLDADQSGYMVRGKSVGFLKSGETSITAAHELAHGIFSLEHTFPEIEQGGTNNLMDYTSASLSVEQRTHLTQKQWYRIHEPLPAWSMFDLEEEGEHAMVNDFSLIEQYLYNDHYLLISPAGKVIAVPSTAGYFYFSTLNSNVSLHENPIGSLTAFELNGLTYNAKYIHSSNQFLGYSTEQGQYYFDTIVYSIPAVSPDQLLDPNFSLEAIPRVVTGSVCFDGSKFTLQFYQDYFLNQYKPILFEEINRNYADGVVSNQDVLGFIVPGQVEVKGHTINYENSLIEYFQLFNLEGSFCENRTRGVILNAFLLSQNPELLECLPEFQDVITDITSPYYDYLYTDGSYETNRFDSLGYAPIESFNHDRTAAIIEYISHFRKIVDLTNNLDLEDYTLNQIVSDFISVSDNPAYSCLVKQIPFELRLQLLNAHYTEWSVFNLQSISTTKEDFLIDLIEHIPFTDIPRLLEELEKEDFRLFWELYVDINASNSDYYTELITSYLILSSNHTSIKNSLISVGPPNSGFSSDFVQLYKTTTLDYFTSTLPYYLLPDHDNDFSETNGEVQIEVNQDFSYLYESTNYTFKARAFDFVKIVFEEDFQFSIQGNQIVAGTELVLPAFMAYHILYRQASTSAWTGARIAMEVVAIVATAGAASAEVVALEIAIGTTNIVLELSSDYILSSDSDELKQLHNSLSFVSMITSLGIAAPSMAIGIQNFIYKISNNYKTYLSKVNTFFKSQSEELIKILDDIENLPINAFTEVSGTFNQFKNEFKFIRCYLNILIKSEIVNPFTEFAVNNLGRVFINNRYVADVSETSAKTPIITPFDFLNDNNSSQVTKLFSVNNISFTRSNEQLTGSINFFKYTDGTIAATTIGYNKALLLSKLPAEADVLKAWVNVLDDVKDSPLMSSIDQLDVSYLSMLNNDLASVSNGAGLKVLLKESPSDLTEIWKLLKDDPKYAYELSKTGGDRWIKWANGNYFKTITKAGKDFEDFVSNNLAVLRLKILEKYPDIDLNDYAIFEQVQIKTGQITNGTDEFFVADFVLVKKEVDIVTGIEDLNFNTAIVLETKLSNTTALTTPQTNALTKVKTTSNSFEIRTISKESKTNSEFVLGSGTDFKNLKIIDYIKVNSNGIGNTIQDVNSLKYEN
jgi:hypothetical protein